MISRQCAPSMYGLPCREDDTWTLQLPPHLPAVRRRPPSLVHDPLHPGADRHRDRHRCSATSFRSIGDPMKPLGDGFIALIKMMIAPVIFCTVVHGIALDERPEEGRPRRRQDAVLFRGGLDLGAGDRPAGRRARCSPAAGFNIDPATLDPKAVASYVDPRQGGGHRRPSPGDHPGHLLRRARRAAICSRCC